MKRLGKFTGQVYDENFDTSNIKECCTLITDVEANDDDFIDRHHVSDLMDCVICLGCEEAQRSSHGMKYTGPICERCEHVMACPVGHRQGNAACITIYKPMHINK